jgi:hypothetical protein
MFTKICVNIRLNMFIQIIILGGTCWGGMVNNSKECNWNLSWKTIWSKWNSDSIDRDSNSWIHLLLYILIKSFLTFL